MREKFYSYHVFLFPFKWEYRDADGFSLEQQTDLKKVHESILQDSKWTYTRPGFPLKNLIGYNESNFFYDFVRTAMYDSGSPDSFLHHYHMNIAKPSFYCFNVKGKEYRLEIDDVLLHMYNTGVGILSFHLFNRLETQKDKKNILEINQFGRRVYPPFYSTLWQELGEQEFFDDDDWLRGLDGVKQAELADRIFIEAGGSTIIAEDFSPTQTPPDPDALPRFIEQVVGAATIKLLNLSPVLDDRMFTLCWYGNDELVTELKQRADPLHPAELDKKNYHYEDNDWWYQFVFVDGGYRTCQNDEMVLELIRKHSNARWINNGTLYGASRYSFVSITSQLSRLENFNFLVSNVMAMYYKMVELCLLQRASILRFSNEVTKISRLTNEKNLPKRVSSLYKEYIRFVNKIYFREVTAQEQGIELYDLLQKHMRIEQQVKDLDGEINELHEYVMMQEEAARNNKLDRISYLGAGFLIPTFMLSMYALSSDDPMAIRIWAVFSVIPALLAFVSGKKWHIFFLVVLMAMIVIGLIILK